MLTDREFRAMKTILSVSVDPEVRKILQDRVAQHEQELALRDVSRRARIIKNRFLREKGIAVSSADGTA